ncbi:MAG: hypothetical protein IPJ61_14775 [Tessaracoccus sp.]|uniref:hypothetical protein n=1 Tax=Tessaracoccus sp. TaxID=1971211 RepID=UPI001EB70133|nr:hypothetical protein [Tessaracoccus sp.]MBK7822278.1 hypothetical protein [Tessaracoccus sp.]
MSMDPGPFGDVEWFDMDHDGMTDDMIGHSIPMAPDGGGASMYAGDTNQDFVPDAAVADRNGDGIPDVYFKDTNLDGRIDVVELDDDQDGRIEARLIDVDGDGVVEAAQLIDERSGRITHQSMDANHDGIDDYTGVPGATATVPYNITRDGHGLWHIMYANVPVPVTPVEGQPQIYAPQGQLVPQLSLDPEPQPQETAPADGGTPSLMDLYEQVMNTPIDENDPDAVDNREKVLRELLNMMEIQNRMNRTIIDAF